jgi:hypothetical protein
MTDNDPFGHRAARALPWKILAVILVVGGVLGGLLSWIP